MKSPSPSRTGEHYESCFEFQSSHYPAVRCRVIRPSFRRRLELTQLLGDLVQTLEYHESGSTWSDQCKTARLATELDILIVRWGLVSIDGLHIDGEPAVVDTLIERGPEALTRELSERIRRECGLTDDERKN